VGGVNDDILFARAFLNRVAEPASIPLWLAVRRNGPVATAQAIRSGEVAGLTSEATAARVEQIDPYADLEAAQRRGVRLVVPESDEWPHFAFSALEAAALRRAERFAKGERTHSESGELIPPLALWVRGTVDLAAVGVRSVAIVGARSATDYGERLARELAAGLSEHGVTVVSGGAYGIDAAAHRGALVVGGETVLVSAGGLDKPYPAGNAGLFDQVAECGLLVSESPPGCDPRRRRFLTRNRLIAALSTGTLVVEAAYRSGALNTARHCVELGRPLMAVPGPVTSPMSAGCHRLLAAEQGRAQLVTGLNDVLQLVGSSRDLAAETDPIRRENAGLRERLDILDATARQVFDGFPARGWTDPDRLAIATGLAPLAVVRALPMLELSGLIEASAEGFRIARPAGVRTHDRAQVRTGG
jgi:DNA processing protein